MPPARKKIRVGEAALAIGKTPKALQQWIGRYGTKGVKPSAEQTGSWYEFSFGDVAALALTRRFVDLGSSAHWSFLLAGAVVQQRWPHLFDEEDPSWSWTDTSAFLQLYCGQDDDWKFSDPKGEEPLTPPKGTRVTVTLAAASIVNDAFEALEGMGHEPPRLGERASSTPTTDTEGKK